MPVIRDSGKWTVVGVVHYQLLSSSGPFSSPSSGGFFPGPLNERRTMRVIIAEHWLELINIVQNKLLNGMWDDDHPSACALFLAISLSRQSHMGYNIFFKLFRIVTTICQ